MGAFADWQPAFAELGIATFPVGEDKRPAVRGYLQLKLNGSFALARKYAQVDCFGFAVRPNRIAIVDVDSPDRSLLSAALRTFGETPVIVQSGSGNYQLWYRHSGEARRIRPDPSRPIDILGSGYVIAPPSRGSKQRYRFVEGGVGDIYRLPAMKQSFEVSASPLVGRRNDMLFRHALALARSAGTLADVTSELLRANKELTVPLGEAEVTKTARSAWGYQLSGRNFSGGCAGVVIDNDLVMTLGPASPDALFLLAMLTVLHSDRPEFALANKYHQTLRWTLRRFQAARLRLEEFGVLRCVHRGGRGVGDPPIFSLVKVRSFAHQYN